MKKFSVLFFIIALIFNSIPLSSAFAYSYGDPNEEKVAEVYKEMVVKLDENPPNYNSAIKNFETVKEEIDMHMGPEPAKLILNNLNNKDKEATLNNMEKLLVLNIARRLESIEKDFVEYDTTKRLLAKAFATYDALSPKWKLKNPRMIRKSERILIRHLKHWGIPDCLVSGKKKRI